MMIHIVWICLAALTIPTVHAAKKQLETEPVPESYVSRVPLSPVGRDPGLEKLVNQFRPGLMAPVFHVFSTGDRGGKPAWCGKSFDVTKDFPKDAPEIVCIITGGGSGFYRETVLLFQRLKNEPGGWKKMAEFYLANPTMPWNDRCVGVSRILLIKDCIKITVKDFRQECGEIFYSFRMEKGIYKPQSILISGNRE